MGDWSHVDAVLNQQLPSTLPRVHFVLLARRTFPTKSQSKAWLTPANLPVADSANFSQVMPHNPVPVDVGHLETKLQTHTHGNALLHFQSLT